MSDESDKDIKVVWLKQKSTNFFKSDMFFYIIFSLLLIFSIIFSDSIYLKGIFSVILLTFFLSYVKSAINKRNTIQFPMYYSICMILSILINIILQVAILYFLHELEINEHIYAIVVFIFIYITFCINIPTQIYFFATEQYKMLLPKNYCSFLLINFRILFLLSIILLFLIFLFMYFYYKCYNNMGIITFIIYFSSFYLLVSFILIHFYKKLDNARRKS